MDNDSDDDGIIDGDELTVKRIQSIVTLMMTVFPTAMRFWVALTHWIMIPMMMTIDDEVSGGTDPIDSDSDDDGINDGDELTGGTDPVDSDSDDDGLNDSEDDDPNNPDVDDDGVLDGIDPDNTTDDADGDGVTDADELRMERIQPTVTLMTMDCRIQKNVNREPIHWTVTPMLTDCLIKMN